jgi:glutamyl-tRNA synthetase
MWLILESLLVRLGASELRLVFVNAAKELVTKFDLNRVHKAGAKFDPEKNKWFNHQYLQKQTDSALAASFASILNEKGISTAQDLTRIVSLIKERAHFVAEFWELADYFFVAPTAYDEKASKNWKEETPALMQQLIGVLKTIEDFTSVPIETVVKEWMSQKEIGMGKVMQPFRLSLVGALKGPHLFDIVELIGKEESIKRLEKAIATI